MAPSRIGAGQHDEIGLGKVLIDAGNDIFYGYNMDVTGNIYGDAGDDYFVLIKSAATLYGGTGNDIYRAERRNYPSINGPASFPVFYSVRQQKHTGGTITTGNHFAAWAQRGMDLGTQYAMVLAVEGYQSSGTADITVYGLPDCRAAAAESSGARPLPAVEAS